jgi:transcriptional regulator with XRE-family HTH domain
VDKMTISKWERGLRAPSGEYLVALIETLHCTGDFLLGFSDTLQLRREI